MSHFAYRGGRLHAEEVPVEAIARAVGTPFYCYSTAALTSSYGAFRTAFAGLPIDICYSLKANSNRAVVATLLAEGAGADVVSEGELRQALSAGAAPERIVFAGVGKTAREMRAGLEAGIRQFNVESLPELRRLDEVAQAIGRRAPVALRINPDVDARTHAKISTGMAETKFGVDLGHAVEVYAEAARLPGISVLGLAVHIGSQLSELGPYREAYGRMAELVGELRRAGHQPKSLDLGGGLGIGYGVERPPALADYASLIGETVGGLGLELILEPGRRLVGDAGILVAEVLYVKQGVSRDFIVVDAAMNDLIRPALYDAYHPILPVNEPASDAPVRRFDVVGPICETGDRFAEQRPLPPVVAGDLLAFCAAGAYGAVMSSQYNSRPPAAEVLVRGENHEIVKPRLTYDAILAMDRMPSWLGRPTAKRSRGAA
jgi:diaminopimelate decarboxylase